LKTKGSTLPDSFMAAQPATVCVWFGVTSMALIEASARERFWGVLLVGCD
jgi:hypothetical protein